VTEQEKLDTYLDQTLQIDRSDPAASQRVLDITGAWMYRSQEAPPVQTDWKPTVEYTLRRLNVPMTDTPSQATTAIDAGLATLDLAVQHANTQVQSLATMQEIVKNQGNILDAFAMILQLPSGALYMDMVPLLQGIVATAQGNLPSPDAPVQ
jgi:hypothetical protein